MARWIVGGRGVTGAVTTWLDGRVQTVPADDARLAEQEEQRIRLLHVANMRRLPLHGRQEYLANVARKDGALARDRLAEAFAAEWEARRAPNVRVEPGQTARRNP